MTKENFEKYDKTQNVYCECCKKYKKVEAFTYKNIKTNNRVATRCNACNWIKVNHDGNIPEIYGYNKQEILGVISFIFDKQGEYVNDLASIIGKNIDETIELVYSLNLKNIHIAVKTNCECCKKEMSSKISVYKKNKNIYCSYNCYWADKTNKMDKGENSKFYNRIKTNCTNCGKELNIIPNKYNTKNSFGDNHNFCSQQCYWLFRSKYYIEEKASMYNHECTEEEKELHRKILLDRLDKSDRLNTKIQIKIDTILDNENIEYEREKVFDYYAVDNYLKSFNGIIEVMGDYWHVNPLRYNENNYFINEMQQKQLHRDKIKHSYISNHYDIPILYLWETDINNNPELCILLIKEYIKNPKLLSNYHSFNWQSENNCLSIKNKIITPYQDMSIDEYRHLIKKKVG